MSSGYDEVDADDLVDAEDDGFYRGWTARSASERDCCEHQPTCPSQHRSWWQRVRGALS